MPMIEYAIQWALLNKFKDIIVVVSGHREKLESYFRDRKQICLLYSEESISIGDVLRQLQGHHSLQSDFFLLFGDFVANIDVSQMISDHFTRKHESSNNIVTCLMRRVKPSSLLLSQQEDFVYVLDTANQQLLQIEKLSSDQSEIALNVDRIKLVKGHSQGFQLRYDLLDLSVYICSLDVLKAFKENFTFHSLRNDFIKEMLTSEINEEKIFVHVASDTEYGARVLNPCTYYQISLDLMNRHAMAYSFIYYRYAYPLSLERMAVFGGFRFLL